MGKVTQHQKIINHLNTHRCITMREAFSRYGISQLATRIKELEQKGYLINHDRVSRIDDDGVVHNFVEYSLMTEGDFGSENK